MLTDNVNALMFDQAQPGALEGALTRLCSDTSLRQRLAQGAANTIDRLELTWIGNARRVIARVESGA
ncbi:MAG: Glycosyl transferase group 1 [uncultured bacterium]|nr:MAG: Glycosyl transferase group 1 [uncultured bacterium]